MMRHIGLLVLCASLACCKQSDGVGTPDAPSASSGTVAQQASPKEDSSVTPPETHSGPDPAKQAELEHFINQKYGDQATRSAEERELIAFVEKFVDVNGVPFPRPRGHLVARQGDGWNVTMLDLDSLRRGERPKELTYHLRRVDGRLEITHGLVP